MGHRKGRRWKRGEGEGGKGVGEANGGEGKGVRMYFCCPLL